MRIEKMTQKKPQQVKKQEPVQQAEQAASPAINGQERATSTIQVSIETKGRLDVLKDILNQPDYNSTVSRIIDIIPEKLSTEEEIHLIMPVGKYRWLLSHQDHCDCRQFLEGVVR